MGSWKDLLELKEAVALPTAINTGLRPNKRAQKGRKTASLRGQVSYLSIGALGLEPVWVGRQCSLLVPSSPLLFAELAHVDTLNLISFLGYGQRVLPWAHGAVVNGYPSCPQWPQYTFGCIVPSAVLSVLLRNFLGNSFVFQPWVGPMGLYTLCSSIWWVLFLKRVFMHFGTQFLEMRFCPWSNYYLDLGFSSRMCLISLRWQGNSKQKYVSSPVTFQGCSPGLWIQRRFSHWGDSKRLETPNPHE